MRFMIIRKADKNTEAEKLPKRELLEAMLRYNEQMARAGVFVTGEGLRATSKDAARIKIGDTGPMVTEGPFAETNELIAGFSIIQVTSYEEALEWVKKWPVEDAPVELELRRVFEAEDFGDAFTPELQEAEERLRQQTKG